MSDALERMEKRVTTEGAAWVPMLVNEDKFADSADADLRALCAEVRALRADKARLDWLEARARKDESVEVGWSPAGFESDEYGGSRSSWPGGYYAVACDADGLYDHESLRAALDAAKEAR